MWSYEKYAIDQNDIAAYYWGNTFTYTNSSGTHTLPWNLVIDGTATYTLEDVGLQVEGNKVTIQ